MGRQSDLWRHGQVRSRFLIKSISGSFLHTRPDSLFVCVPGATREQAFKVGKEIAEAVTKANPWPVTLQFEKVYHPCILLAKKVPQAVHNGGFILTFTSTSQRYVGYKYESSDQKEPTFEAKGIETVRRDTCPAVSKILEKSLRYARVSLPFHCPSWIQRREMSADCCSNRVTCRRSRPTCSDNGRSSQAGGCRSRTSSLRRRSNSAPTGDHLSYSASVRE